MRKCLAALVGGLCLVLGARYVEWAVPAFAKAETVTGQVVDLVCYARDKANTGMNHGRDLMCAWACVKWEGNPVGLVTADGKVYQLTGALVADNNARIAPHLARTVTVTGDVFEKEGMMMLEAGDVTVVGTPGR